MIRMKRTPSQLFFSGLIGAIMCLFANTILYAASEEQSQTTPAAIDLDLIQALAWRFAIGAAAARDSRSLKAPSRIRLAYTACKSSV